MNWLQANPDGLLHFVEIGQALDMDRSNFRRVRLHEDFVRAIQAEGIEEYRPNRYAIGFRYAEEEPSSEDDYRACFTPVDDTETA